MSLSRFLDWSMTVRNSRFPGRSVLGRAYRTLLFSILDGLFKLAYRIRIFLREKSLTPFLLSEYRLLKAVREQFPSPNLCRRWVKDLTAGYHPARYTDVLSRIRAAKRHTRSVPWLLPETALLAPELDCKGFSVLFSSLLNAMGIRNELWIGLPSDGGDGHAWVVLETMEGRVAVDQFNGNGTPETLFRIHHPYSVTFRV